MTDNKVSGFCRSCKHLYDVDRTMEPYRGKCEVWECWQKCQDKACMHFEMKERPDWQNSRRDFRPRSNDRRYRKP